VIFLYLNLSAFICVNLRLSSCQLPTIYRLRCQVSSDVHQGTGKRQSRRKCGDITQLEKNIISRKGAKSLRFPLLFFARFASLRENFRSRLYQHDFNLLSARMTEPCDLHTRQRQSRCKYRKITHLQKEYFHAKERRFFFAVLCVLA